jgi:uncharacterized membrane protein YfbV (UPF0208 family)
MNMKIKLNSIFDPVMIILGGCSMALCAVNTALTQSVTGRGALAALMMALVSVAVSALGGGWLVNRMNQQTSLK